MKKGASLAAGILFTLLCLGIMAYIFYMSSQNGITSSAISSKATRFISKIVFFGFRDMSAATQEMLIQYLDPFIRKLAHFAVYMALGFFAYWGGFFMFRKTWVQFVYGLCVPVVYAAADEIHQLFVSERSGKLIDVLLDSAGGLIGVLAAFLIISAALRIAYERKEKRLKTER